MSEDKELQVRLQFLEEAQEYIDNMESGLLGLGSGKVNSQQMDGVLRAAHSIKGGAAMMGFQHLSHLAHRLEDFFKVLKIGKTDAIDSQLENALLSGVDFLRQIIAFNRRRVNVDEQWLENIVNPLFKGLHDRLGDPQPEDAAALLSSELGEDMSTLIFETEVEELLQQLETRLKDPGSGNLAMDLLEAAGELNGLGEMLELPAFANLCTSVIDRLETNPEQLIPIAEVAVREWRRSQALVLIGQVEVIPHELEIDESDFFNSDRDLNIESLPDSIAMSSILEVDNLEEQALDLFSSIDSMIPDFQEEESTGAVVAAFTELNTEPEPLTASQPPTVAPETAEPVREKTIRVSVKQLDELSDLFGEIAIERNGLGLRLKSLHNLVNLLRQRIKILEQSNFKLRIAYDKVATEHVTAKSAVSDRNILVTSPALQPASRSSAKNYFDSLEMDSYSDIHLLSQEVMEKVVQIKEVAQDIEISLEDTDKNARQLTRATKQMQSTITRVRMRPISDLLDRFPRALRDLEMQHGKKVQLKIRGAATLVDRSILEALNDPLLHLFRNAFDHGIESPAARLAANKPETGTITISASHRGNQTAIILSDDGGGINLDKIKDKAVSALGLQSEDLADASEEEILDLIFEPGFSTADRVTDLSGRGVGMDVVRTNIEQVNGTIQVDTKLGLGTNFIIKVPFTLSIVRILLVESNGMLLAFPTNVVEEMLVLNPDLVVKTNNIEALDWDGYMIRLIRLDRWFDFADSAYNAANELESSPTIEEPTVLIIAQDEELVGIQVDRYWQEEEVTVRSVEGNIALPPGFTGCTVLGNGRVVPLIDVTELLNWIQEKTNRNSYKNRLKEISKQTLTAIPKPKSVVMVIDDSINVRRFLTLTLEKANYQVEQAKDGQDALDKLKTGLMPQAIVCDIEMPRLDGFGFLSRVKAEGSHKHIPIIMLTSRSGDKHKKLAINLGATDYFTKPFKEQLLTNTLAKLIKPN